MKLLLDTHVLLWSVLEPDHLATQVRADLESPQNELWLSPITLWEIHILAERGRIELTRGPAKWIQHLLDVVPFREAAITHKVAVLSRTITLPHQDPADRFLAATAQLYDLILLTADERLLSARVCNIMPAQ